MIASNAAAESVYRQGNDRLFGVVTTTRHYAESFIDMVHLKGATRATVLHSDNIFNQQVAEGALEYLRKLEFKIDMEVEWKADNSTALRAAIVQACNSSAQPEVLFIIGQKKHAANSTRNAFEAGCKPGALYITSGPSDAQFVSEHAEMARHFHFVGPAQWWPTEHYKDKLFGDSAHYTRQYQARFGIGGVPSYIAAQVSAAGMLLMEALEAIWTVGAAPPSQDQLAAQLRRTSTEFFYGPVRFSERGRNAGKPMVTTQVVDGKIRVVAPPSQAEVEFVFPVSYTRPPTAAPTDTPTRMPAVLETGTFGAATLVLFPIWALVAGWDVAFR